MKKGLILEDFPEAADWLDQALQQAFPGIEVHHAATLAGGRQQLEVDPPDIALVDIGLPDGSGLELVRGLSDSGCYPVVVTMFDGDEQLFHALQLGARGYILKDQSKDELVALLQGIVQGRPPLSAAIASRMMAYFRQSPDTPHGVAESVLTTREEQVLMVIAQGLSLNAAAAELQISRHTVGDHVKNIYRKLDISTRAEAALEASRLGILPRH